jgi:ABC-type amino acid transport substrate-binding protein
MSVHLTLHRLLVGMALAAAVAPSSPRAAEAAGAGSKDLRLSIAIIPGLAEPPGKGPFVELAQAIAENYTEGKITIELYPFGRAIENVLTGRADLEIPNLQNPDVDASQLPYRYSAFTYGRVDIVVYSNVNKVITGKMLDEATAQHKAGKPFPWVIEGVGGLQPNYPFPTVASNDFDASFKKLAAGRIDAFVGAQEECDMVVTALKAKSVHRSEWKHFRDISTLPKGPRGDEVDRLLTPVIEKLARSGRLQQIQSKVHVPYKEWQPADMGW